MRLPPSLKALARHSVRLPAVDFSFVTLFICWRTKTSCKINNLMRIKRWFYLRNQTQPNYKQILLRFRQDHTCRQTDREDVAQRKLLLRLRAIVGGNDSSSFRAQG